MFRANALFTFLPLLPFIFQIIRLLKTSASGSSEDIWPKTRRVVGIFSREGAESYHLLSQALQLVAEVWPSTITNNGWSKFGDDVSQCDFAILYHSKNRGRVNITNVTDSLYDDELQYLSETLGKTRVIVLGL